VGETGLQGGHGSGDGHPEVVTGEAWAAAPNTVSELIEQATQRWPQAVYACDIDDRQRITYAELREQCAQVAGLLRAAGSVPGDTVSLVMPNGLQTLRLLLGAMHGGWCVNPVNLLSQPDQMRYVLDHSDCKFVLASPEWAERVQGVLNGLSRPVTLIVTEADALELPSVPAGSVPDALSGEPSASAQADASGARLEQGHDHQAAASGPAPDDLALLMYTSGTTGVPKGVMLTQANLAANAQAISAEHALVPGDRVLAVLPLYHINAFAVTMLAPLAHGGSLAMPPKFSTGAFWQQAVDNGCTWINAVPTMISYLLEGEAPPRDSTQAIRFCRSASSALPPEYLRAFEQRFGIGVIETMGLTETVAPSFSNQLEAARRKIGSVGRASGGQARVVDGALQPVPDGTTGEIDEALLQHPAVLEAVAVGIPDRHYGQEILACIVPREGMACTEADLRAFCLEKLGRYKTPGVFRFVTELPSGPSGKVQRLKLAQEVT